MTSISELKEAQTPKIPEPKEMLVDTLGQQVILFDDHVEALIGDNKGAISKKISYEDFSTIIGSVLDRRNTETMETFQLPANCFFMQRSASAINLSCYYAERTAKITYIDTKYEVKFPNVIISHMLQRHNSTGWKSIEARYYVTDNKVGNLGKEFIFRLDSSKRIWLFPFPNTYSEGNMCYGGNSMPTVFLDGNLSGLNWYYQFLFDSPFNNDLGLRAVAGDPSIAGWLRKLSDCASKNLPFPYNELRGYTKPAA